MVMIMILSTIQIKLNVISIVVDNRYADHFINSNNIVDVIILLLKAFLGQFVADE
jgi:hypothetical protein